ncbi:MAG TPA: SIR2 family protein [Gammaproteobacteria bacterium]
MNDEEKRIIEEQLAPLVRSGKCALYLGAGFSASTPTRAGYAVPTSTVLAQDIATWLGFDQEVTADDLPKLFALAEKDPDRDFAKFLRERFLDTKPWPWQTIPFCYWWRSVITTNIDDIVEQSIQTLRARGIGHPQFEMFGHLDARPPVLNPAAPPVVFLHGSANKMQDGFVFGRSQYARFSRKQPDWLNDAALQLHYGHCLIVGSRLEESDLDSALIHREEVHGESSRPNWIVTRSLTELDRRSYESRNIFPIQAEAEEFFDVLADLCAPPTVNEFIESLGFAKVAKPSKLASFGWFASEFEEASSAYHDAAEDYGVISKFAQGAEPEWYYFQKGVVAEFGYYKEAKQLGEDLLKRSAPCALVVTGKVGSGKSACAMWIAREFAEGGILTYRYVGSSGIDIEHVWNVLKELEKPIVILVDDASEYFYAVTELSRRLNAEKKGLPVLFVLEDRIDDWSRNSHQLIRSELQVVEFSIPQLNVENAQLLVVILRKLGCKNPSIANGSVAAAAEFVVQAEHGYAGDLMATMYDVFLGRDFEEKISEEFSEIESDLAKQWFEYLNVVSAVDLPLPVYYVRELFGVNVYDMLPLLSGELESRVRRYPNRLEIGVRHKRIAEHNLVENISDERRYELFVSLLKVVSTKFSVKTINEHPLPYRIYKKLLSHRYLLEKAFRGRPDLIASIYEAVQICFSQDGIFWLQFGSFLLDEGRVDEAIDAIRHGNQVYSGSFQIEHALANALLQRYLANPTRSYDDYEEAIGLLEAQIEIRGAGDPYPVNTLLEALLRIDREVGDLDLYQERVMDRVVKIGDSHHLHNRHYRRVREDIMALRAKN